jgi:exosome complex RNA-binding protein Rrp42 (RNase PH superfamily)
VDPGLNEEAACSGALTVVVNAHGDVCSLSKASGAGVGMTQAWRGLPASTACPGCCLTH